jgi:hypothetical protein
MEKQLEGRYGFSTQYRYGVSNTKLKQYGAIKVRQK